MAEDFAIGKELEIPKSVLDNIEKIDKKINDISKDSELMAQHFGSAMIRMGNGAETLLKKLQQVHQIVSGLNNLNIKGLSDISNGMNKTATDSEKMANSLSKAAAAINKSKKVDDVFNPQNSVLAWQGLQKNIAQIQERQEKLTTITKEYESTLKSIKSGKGGVLTKDMQDSYKAAQKELEANKQIIESYKQKQQAIIAYQREQKKEAQNAEALRSIATGGSLNEQRQIDAMKRMNDYYRELERTSASAEKKRQEEAKKSAREVEKATQKEQREREKSAKSAERQQKAEERLRKSQEQRTNNNAINAYNRAMASSEALITQRINKIAKLRQAEEMLLKTGKGYSANIAKIRSEIERLNRLNQGQVDSYGRIIKSHQNLMNTSDQLMRKLALIVSVSQIQGYLLQVRDVTGEFEKQNTALASILQNKDKADKLFGQITELAVKSPFTLKELITYTKSLSAYQVEYEKLYDTTKMLADVSSGLGVDMERLILAFGQVKASNFLRGTEVRQFTEAGFNILGELAKYYSELEGRMISVGEVQDRVTKRMVAFGDVEKIFKRVTSAGGIFYNMQEKQSETIAGLVSNLRDSIDLMLNDIGSANSGTIKQIILFVRSLYENWREVAWYIEKAVVVLGIWKTTSLLVSIGNSTLVKTLFNVADASLQATQNMSRMEKVMNGVKSAARGLLAGGAILLVSWLLDLYRQATKTSRELERLSETLGKLVNTDVGNLDSLISSLDDLIARMKLSNEGSQERRDIISSLNSNYGEYLDFVVDETTSIKDLTDAYDGVIKKMKEKAALSTLEKGYQEISNFYEENLTEARETFEKELSRGLSTDLGFGGFKKAIKPTKDELNDLFNILQNRIRETDSDLLKTSREQRTLLQEIVKEYYGSNVTLSQDYLKTIPIIDLFLDKKEKEEELQSNINSAYKETLKSKEANIALSKREAQLELEKEKISNEPLSAFETKKKLQEAVEKFELDKIDIKLKFGEISEAEAKRQKDKIINWADATVKDVNDRLRKELLGYSEEDLSKVLINREEQATGLTSIQKTVKQNWGTQVSTIEQLTKLKNNNISIDEKLLANAEKLKVMYEKKAEILGVELEAKKESGRKDNSDLQRLKDQISLIKKAGDEYKKLRQYYSEGDATKQVRESFADAFSNLGLDIAMSFDTEGVVKGIENLTYKTIQGGKEAVDEALAPLKNEQEIKIKATGIEEIQKQVESIFSNYEFNLELQSAGIDTIAFKNMLQDLGATDEEISMVGLDASTFEEAADKVRKVISELQEEGGESQLQQARKFQEQLTALEVKEARKRFDELAKLREKYQTNQEKMQTVQSNLFDDKGALALLEEQKAMGNEVNKEQEELLKLRIQAGEDALLQLRSEALQLTDFWQKLFGDLNDISVSSLLDLSRITDEIIANRSEIKGDKGELKGYSSSYTDKNGMKKEVTLTKQQYQQLLKQNNQVADEIQKKNPFHALYEAMLKGKKEGETQLDYYTRLESILGDVSNAAFGAAENLMDIFNANDEAKEMLNNIKGIADGAINLGMGAAKIASGDIIGGGFSAISGIASIVTSIGKIHDNKREREIERQIDLIEDLQRSYEKMQEAIEGAYSVNTYKASYEQSIADLQAQNEAFSKAIAAEQDKKKTDDDRIEEWQNKIQDNLDRIQELEEQFISDLGGFGSKENVKSAAQEFADAWLEAYMETGDGLDALSDKWDEYIQNVVAKQLMLKGTEKYLRPVMDMLDGMLEDSVFTPTEAQDIQDKIDEVIPQLNEFWKAIAGSFDLGAASEGDTMSGLSKSISSITEDQADALASITESIRFFAADSNGVLKQIYNWLINPPVESGIMQEMKVQSEQLRLMYSLWSSMSTTKAGISGKALKVQIV